jgi:hypothetical protein
MHPSQYIFPQASLRHLRRRVPWAVGWPQQSHSGLDFAAFAAIAL